MSYIKVTDHPGLMRDSNTGAIINVDQTKAKQAVINRQRAKAQRESVDNLNGRVENLEANVVSINTKLDALIELLKNR